MTTQIRRADFADYASYIDAIAEPIGGATNPTVWDEDEQMESVEPLDTFRLTTFTFGNGFGFI